MSSELTVWLGGVAMLTVAACGAAQTNASKVELPAEVGELPKGLEDEYHVFAVNCSKCHGIERALTSPVNDRGHWERYVGRMMRTPGSGISAQEAPSILAFLFWYSDKRSGQASSSNDNVAPVPAQAPTLLPEPTSSDTLQGEGSP
jgi:hypothetical protein